MYFFTIVTLLLLVIYTFPQFTLPDYELVVDDMKNVFCNLELAVFRLKKAESHE